MVPNENKCTTESDCHHARQCACFADFDADIFRYIGSHRLKRHHLKRHHLKRHHLKRHAAIDQVRLPGDVAGFIGGEEDRERRHLLGLAEPAHGLAFNEGLLDFGK